MHNFRIFPGFFFYSAIINKISNGFTENRSLALFTKGILKSIFFETLTGSFSIGKKMRKNTEFILANQGIFFLFYSQEFIYQTNMLTGDLIAHTFVVSNISFLFETDSAMPLLLK